MSEFEILLEFRGSRMPLVVTSATLYGVVENAAKVAIAPSPVGRPGVGVRAQEADFYILQRFSDKWSAFVNLQKAEDVVEGDRVTLSLRESVIVLHCT